MLLRFAFQDFLADRFMRVYREFGEAYYPTLGKLGLAAMYEIATLPPEQREVPHELPSGETKKPEDMTLRELRELKRRLKAEQSERERLEKEVEELANKEASMLQRYNIAKIARRAFDNRVVFVTQYIEGIGIITINNGIVSISICVKISADNCRQYRTLRR